MFLPVPILHFGVVEQVSDLGRHAQHLHQQQPGGDGSGNWTWATHIQAMCANH